MAKWSGRKYDPLKTKPVWHWVTCKHPDCGAMFKELSDPRAEYGYCPKHDPLPIKPPAPKPAEDWWSKFWEEHPDIDPQRKEVKEGVGQNKQRR